MKNSDFSEVTGREEAQDGSWTEKKTTTQTTLTEPRVSAETKTSAPSNESNKTAAELKSTPELIGSAENQKALFVTL